MNNNFNELQFKILEYQCKSKSTYKIEQCGYQMSVGQSAGIARVEHKVEAKQAGLDGERVNKFPLSSKRTRRHRVPRRGHRTPAPPTTRISLPSYITSSFLIIISS